MDQTEQPGNGHVEKSQYTDERNQVSYQIATDLQSIGGACHQGIDDIVLITEMKKRGNRSMIEYKRIRVINYLR